MYKNQNFTAKSKGSPLACSWETYDMEHKKLCDLNEFGTDYDPNQAQTR